MNQGDQVRFKAHGETGLLHKLLERSGDECTVQDGRGRVLQNVPIELLAIAPPVQLSAMVMDLCAEAAIDGRQVLAITFDERTVEAFGGDGASILTACGRVEIRAERADECSMSKS